jgi:hypothetical protein
VEDDVSSLALPIWRIWGVSLRHSRSTVGVTAKTGAQLLTFMSLTQIPVVGICNIAKLSDTNRFYSANSTDHFDFALRRRG